MENYYLTQTFTRGGKQKWNSIDKLEEEKQDNDLVICHNDTPVQVTIAT